MPPAKISEDLATIRATLANEKLDPANAMEFYCQADKLEALKQDIRKKCEGQCFFFTKEEGQKIHVLALVNITIEKMTNEAALKVINTIQDKTFKKSEFSPSVLKFTNNKPSPKKPQ
jgi:hypothetical protein